MQSKDAQDSTIRHCKHCGRAFTAPVEDHFPSGNLRNRVYCSYVCQLRGETSTAMARLRRQKEIDRLMVTELSGLYRGSRAYRAGQLQRMSTKEFIRVVNNILNPLHPAHYVPMERKPFQSRHRREVQ